MQWVTRSLQKSILIKNSLFTNYTNLKDLAITNEAQLKYKQYRSL